MVIRSDNGCEVKLSCSPITQNTVEGIGFLLTLRREPLRGTLHTLPHKRCDFKEEKKRNFIRVVK
jgi:hypothetical protein